VLEDVCIYNNCILEVSTSRSTTSSSNNNTTTISIKLIFCTKMDLLIQHLTEIVPSESNWVVKTVVNEARSLTGSTEDRLGAN